MGVEEFDACDRALVWRVTGGKHRYLIGDADALVADNVAAFRAAAVEQLTPRAATDLGDLMREHERLGERLARFGDAGDALEIWKRLGIEKPEGLPLLEAADFVAIAQDRGWRRSVDLSSIGCSPPGTTSPSTASSSPEPDGPADARSRSSARATRRRSASNSPSAWPSPCWRWCATIPAGRSCCSSIRPARR